jgi:putative ABC transport system ATP-binding protein
MSSPDPGTGGRLLAATLARHRAALAAAALLFAAHEVGEALVPVTIGLVVDHAVDGGGTGDILRWLVVLAAVFVLLSLTYRFGARAAVRAAQHGAHRLRLRLTDRILDPAGGVTDRWHPGELVSIASSDADRVGRFLGTVAGGFSAVCAVAFAAVVVLRISWPLGLLVLAGAPVLLAVTHRVSRRFEARSGAEQQAAARTAALATDLVTGLRVLRGIGAAGAASDRYRRDSARSREASIAAARTSASVRGLAALCNGCYLAAIALVGGRLAVEGTISAGSVISALGLAQFLIGPLTGLTSLSVARARALASARRIAAVLAAPPAVAVGTGTPDPAGAGELRIEGLRTGTLAGVDLTVPAGSLTGVVTDRPADLHALLACLSRQAEPQAGRILLDGVDLATLDPARRAATLVVSDEPTLFAGTVADNVAAAAAGPAAVTAAMTASTVDEVLDALPDGASTEVGERGYALSGGQRQRVALARALATEAPVLVLRDPTSAVDSVTEAAVARGLAELRRGRTTLVFTTSPVLLAACDRTVPLAAARPEAVTP